MIGRDARFDGRFFVGVKTTGIFCRPICPAPRPRRRNCTFWPTAAAALVAGYRPCLRCRPEAAPGSPAWRGTSASVTRAITLIEAGALDRGGSVEDLAERLGMGARHLRRLFERHLGAPPRDIAKMRRTLFAKQLLDETNLSVSEVAASSGFGSLRRLNACIREVYGRSPRDLRRKRGAGQGIELSLAYRPPLDWPSLLGFLADRAIPGVEAVSRGEYRRTIATDRGAGWVRVRQDGDRNRLRASVFLDAVEGLLEIRTQLRRLFDLDADAETIDRVLERHPRLTSHVERFPGMRVPGAFDGFETAVRGILGQQISVKGATTIAERVAERWGRPFAADFGCAMPLRRLFPTPGQLANAPLEEAGIIRTRAETIRGLARAVLDDRSLLEPGPGPDRDLERWVALRGIGPWTASYVAMRVLREPDALPAADLVLRKVLSGSEDGAPCPVGAVEAEFERCRPYRAYAAIRIWSIAASEVGSDRGSGNGR